jgi:hypothetical protein
VLDDLLEDVLPAVVPAQRPARGVPVHLARGVQISQHVVRQHREPPALLAVVVRHGDEVPPRRVRRGDDPRGGEHDAGALLAAAGVHGGHLELEQVSHVLHRRAVALGVAHLGPRLRLVLPGAAVRLGAAVPAVVRRGVGQRTAAAVGGAVRAAAAAAAAARRLIFEVRRFPQRLALVLVPPAVRHAIAHPLPPRLRETLLPAVERLTVHVLQHRRFAGVDAAHGSLAVRSRAVPAVPKVAPVHRIRLQDVRRRGRPVGLARDDVGRQLDAVSRRGGGEGGGVSTEARRAREARSNAWGFERILARAPLEGRTRGRGDPRADAGAHPEIGVSWLSVARATVSAIAATVAALADSTSQKRPRARGQTAIARPSSPEGGGPRSREEARRGTKKRRPDRAKGDAPDPRGAEATPAEGDAPRTTPRGRPDRRRVAVNTTPARRDAGEIGVRRESIGRGQHELSKI